LKDKVYNFFRFLGEYTLYGILFFLPISNALVTYLVILAFFGFIGRKIIKPEFSYLKFRPNIFLTLFLFFSALSLFNSGEYLNKSINALFGKWMQYLGICIIIQDSIYDQKIIKRGMFVFLFGASLAVLSGLSQYFLGVEFLRNRSMIDMPGGMHAITSSFTHYNGLGGYLMVVLSLAVVLLLTDNPFSFRTGSLLIFSMFSTVAIILTFSRGSWLALIISFIFIFIFYGKNFKRLIPIFLMFIAVFFLPAFHERLFSTLKAGGDSDRFRYWLAALKMIKDHPIFGMGVGTFMANFSKYLPDSFVSYAHNCYLQIWAETGVFSLLSFIAFIVLLAYLGIRKFMVSRDFVLLGLLSGFIGFLTHSFFEVNLYSLQLAILFWVWVGLISASIRINNKCGGIR